MNFWEEIKKKVKKGEKFHFTLVDPVKQCGLEINEIIKVAQEEGSAAVMVGGSTVRDRKSVYNTIEVIKSTVSLPVILFPNSATAISRNADYIFFMMLMNARDIRFLVGEQKKGAPLVDKWKIIPIPMAYIVVSTNKKPTAVERVAKVKKIKTNQIGEVVKFALAGQYFGMQCVYLEAGSGAKNSVSSELISAVKKKIAIPLIVGGGIKDPQTAIEKLEAGADIIVTGNIGERDLEGFRKVISAVRHFSIK